MLNFFVGPVDIPAALVLVTLFAMFGMVGVALINKINSRLERELRFELEIASADAADALRIKQAEQAHELALAKIAADRDVQFRRIESGMIDLHATNPNNNQG